MRFRTTLIWLAIAAGLFAFIFLYERHVRNLRPVPATAAFPKINPDAVDTIQVRPGRDLEIRATRTNSAWQLTEPLEWPAQSVAVERFLSTLAKIQPAAYITPADVRARPSAEEDYGFNAPRASIILRQGGTRIHMLAGNLTAPGDQFFLQVVGTEGVYVLGADVLKIFPGNVNEWRDTTVVDLNKNPVDRVSVTNGSKVFSLQRDASRLWRMVFPIAARADQARVHDALERLHSLRAEQFVSDDSGADPETYGFVPSALRISLRHGTNAPTNLLFGRSPTNKADQVYAKRADWNAIVTVPKPFVAAWEEPVDSFRDPFLLSSANPVQSVAVSGKTPFALEWQPSGGWRIAPSNWTGDADLAKEFIARLNGLRIVQFVKDVVTEPDLPPYGLDHPSLTYTVRFASNADTTNAVQLQFGLQQEGKVFARRTDEASVYGVGTNELHMLAAAPWELRERKLWRFDIDDVKKVTVVSEGRVRQVIRQGPSKWELGPGSQGIINDLAVEETVRGLCNASVDRWAALGADQREAFSIRDGGFELSIELSEARLIKIQFGRATPSQGAYAACALDGLVWIGEFPWILCRDIVAHLAPPAPQPK